MSVAETPASILLNAVLAAHRPEDTLTFLTDSTSYPDKVLLALWLPKASCVIVIDRAEYDGLKLAEIFGFKYESTLEIATAKAAAAIAAKPPTRRKR